MEGSSSSCKTIVLVVRILKGERGITTTRGRATNYRPATVKFSMAVLSYLFFDLRDPSRKLRLHPCLSHWAHSHCNQHKQSVHPSRASRISQERWVFLEDIARPKEMQIKPALEIVKNAHHRDESVVAFEAAWPTRCFVVVLCCLCVAPVPG